MITGRVPPWFRDDPTVKTINDEVEDVKLNTYYQFMEAYPKQPLQLWPDFKEKEYTFGGTIWEGNNDLEVDIAGSYPLFFDFQIIVGEVSIPQPIT
ncbi:MAG: hypothetical protein Q8M92_04045, partial [Candidatus Subteraquimicrobiales bacterium]|nr:hypothetical protein [Candidatus Subteraquimicrobiales bacterium]